MTTALGPEDAPVQVKVLWNNPADVEGIFRPMMNSVAASYEENLRVEFVEPESDEYTRLVEEVGVRVGLLINGEMIKEIPEADLGMLAFVGSPQMGEWGEREVRLAIEHELEAAGVEFEPQVQHDHSHAAPGPASSPADGHEGHAH
jgi:hypothetical protein